MIVMGVSMKAPIMPLLPTRISPAVMVGACLSRGVFVCSEDGQRRSVGWRCLPAADVEELQWPDDDCDNRVDEEIPIADEMV